MTFFKEFLGVVKLLEIFFGAFPLLNTVDYSNILTFDCARVHYKYIFVFSYPFDIGYTQPICRRDVQILGDFAAESRYFVFTCVLSIILTLIVILIYSLIEKQDYTNNRLASIDLCLCLVMIFFWITATLAWLNGVHGLKELTAPKTMYKMYHLDDCCVITRDNFRGLNLAVITGFLNVFLWFTNVFFVYRETSCYRGRAYKGVDGVPLIETG